ncbi:MAG: uridine kinase [Planctomycetota bacterium]|nr:uridine kinase [Planctomycetota bacterium]
MANRKDGKIWVDGLTTQFTGQSLSSLDLIESERDHPTIAVLPDLWVLKIGGQSIMDRGAKALKPILKQIVAARKAGQQLLVGTGGGTRARHAYAIGLDLGLPTAMLARIGSTVPVQNARMVQMLTAKDGGIMCYADDFEKLPLYLQLGTIPIMSGMPPFEFWEKAPKVGRIPANRTDAGVYLIAEFFGAKSVIFIKDEDGLYTDDPKKNPNATLIPDITARELLDSGQDDLIVERCVLEYLERASSVKQIRVINGLKDGLVTRALNGENVGSVIRSSKA